MTGSAVSGHGNLMINISPAVNGGRNRKGFEKAGLYMLVPVRRFILRAGFLYTYSGT